jgi:cytoskeletal protein RodZ
VDNTFAEQASIPKFIEDNWNLGRIGGESADAASGTLLNAFNFNQSYGHAPAIILDPTSGEITQTIPATPPGLNASSSTSSSSSSSSAPASTAAGASSSSSGSSTSGAQTVTVALPKVTWKVKVVGNKVTLTFRTKGGSKVSTALRLRAYHAGHLIANHAATVHNHRARFGVKLTKRRAGSYRFVVTVDAGGKVSTLTRSLHVG